MIRSKIRTGLFAKSGLSLPLFLSIVVAALMGSAALLLLAFPFFSGAASLAQDELAIRSGETLDGEITNRFGQTWSFAGCGGEVITLTATTTRFVPFLALSGSLTTTALIEAKGSAAQAGAEIAAFPLPRNDAYSLLVAGSNVRDRGPYSLTFISTAPSDAIDDAGVKLVAGQSITGDVSDRFGAEFLFDGCANNLVTFTLQSAAFVPHLELFGPTGRDPLITTTGAPARIRAFRLPESGLYTVIAAGALLSDRGVFSLSMTLAAGEAPTPTPTPTRTPIPTVTSTATTVVATAATATATATSTPTSPPTPAPSATPTNTPTNTPTKTSTPIPTPTATALADVLKPQGVIVQINGGAGDLAGDLYMSPSYMVSQSLEENTVVVRDHFFLELFVYDPAVGNFDGAGVDRVEFSFICPNGEEYRRTERTARYCSFGGGEPNCTILALHYNDFFPASQCEIANEPYDVQVKAYPKNHDLEPGEWNFQLRLDLP